MKLSLFFATLLVTSCFSALSSGLSGSKTSARTSGSKPKPEPKPKPQRKPEPRFEPGSDEEWEHVTEEFSEDEIYEDIGGLTETKQAEEDIKERAEEASFEATRRARPLPPLPPLDPLPPLPSHFPSKTKVGSTSRNPNEALRHTGTAQNAREGRDTRLAEGHTKEKAEEASFEARRRARPLLSLPPLSRQFPSKTKVDSTSREPNEDLFYTGISQNAREERGARQAEGDIKEKAEEASFGARRRAFPLPPLPGLPAHFPSKNKVDSTSRNPDEALRYTGISQYNKEVAGTGQGGAASFERRRPALPPPLPPSGSSRTKVETAYSNAGEVPSHTATSQLIEELKDAIQARKVSSKGAVTPHAFLPSKHKPMMTSTQDPPNINISPHWPKLNPVRIDTPSGQAVIQRSSNTGTALKSGSAQKPGAAPKPEIAPEAEVAQSTGTSPKPKIVP